MQSHGVNPSTTWVDLYAQGDSYETLEENSNIVKMYESSLHWQKLTPGQDLPLFES